MCPDHNYYTGALDHKISPLVVAVERQLEAQELEVQLLEVPASEAQQLEAGLLEAPLSGFDPLEQ